MGTNGTDIAIDARLDEEALRIPKVDHAQALVDKTARRRPLDNRAPDGADPVESAGDFVLAPLVDKIAYGIARGLVVAMKELENHIASETRKVGDSVDRRLDILQASLQELTRFVGEQRSTNTAVESQLHQLTDGLRETDARQTASVETLRKEAQDFSASVSQRIDVATASLQEADARQTAGLAALQDETKALSLSLSERIDGLCKELGVQQEDIGAVKAAVTAFSSRVDALVERLDRQADAVRSMHTSYSQREAELEQLVDGLARLRAFPAPLPSSAL